MITIPELIEKITSLIEEFLGIIKSIFAVAE